MTYKEYKIINKIIDSDYIKLELDGNIEFSNKKQNYILCPNEISFRDYKVDDKIEVNLINDKHITIKKVPKSVLGGDVSMDDYTSQEKKEEGQLQVQEQVVLLVSAYDKKAVHKLFRGSLKWLEKYIGVVYNEFYPDWQTRKKIHDNEIKRQGANDPNKIGGLLSSSLFGFKTTMEMIRGDKKSKKSLCDEVKKEYYEWLDAVGIDINNCPVILRHFLFEINEILEGRGDKLERDIANRKWEIDPNSIEYEQAFNNLFTNTQVPLENERNEFENLKGKTQKDIKITNNFGGNSKVAEQAFKQMAGRHDYQGFNFMPQKDVQTILQEQSSSSFQGRPNSVILRDIKQNPIHWRIDEVIINGERKTALVHHSVLGETEVDLGSQPVYLPQRFNQAEISEINRTLISSQSSNSKTNYQQKYSKSDLKKIKNAEKSNKGNDSKVGTIATISIFSALVIGGVMLVARNKLKKTKK